MDQVKICDFKQGDEEEVSQLIRKVFDEFVAVDYVEEGNRFFYEYIIPDKILERFQKRGNMILLAKSANKIVGVLDVKDRNHISLLFVDKEYQRQGVFSMLLNEYLKRISSLDVNEITVHASPFSEKIYEKLGFVAQSGMLEANGIKYIPMIRKL